MNGFKSSFVKRDRDKREVLSVCVPLLAINIIRTLFLYGSDDVGSTNPCAFSCDRSQWRSLISTYAQKMDLELMRSHNVKMDMFSKLLL